MEQRFKGDDGVNHEVGERAFPAERTLNGKALKWGIAGTFQEQHGGHCSWWQWNKGMSSRRYRQGGNGCDAGARSWSFRPLKGLWLLLCLK